VLRPQHLAILLGATIGFALVAVAAAAEPQRDVGSGVVRINGHGAEYWHWEYRKALRRNAALERRLAKRERAEAGYALRLAAAAYDVSYRELREVTRCETGGTFAPDAYNGSSGAAGLLQFLASTWDRTPFAAFSRFDPVANALAGARIVSQEGWMQWTCGYAAGPSG
jgi:hypothetical protein